MKMNNEEKIILYVFGCTNLEMTRERLGIVASIIVDQETKGFVCKLRNKLFDKESDKWYTCFYYNLRSGIDSYKSSSVIQDI